MVRILTPNGVDYVKESMLQHFIRTGYCLGLAETVSETVKRIQRLKANWMQKALGRD